MNEPARRPEFHIIFYDNTDQALEHLPRTKVALFAKCPESLPPGVDTRKYQVYLAPYLILSAMIIKDVLARRSMQVLINSFYNYLKPTRYDLLGLDKTRIIHTFTSIEEFFYDILFPDDKGKTRPLEKTPLRDPGLLGGTVSNTQFIRENPVTGEAVPRVSSNLDMGVQVFHFEKLFTIYDKLNNIVISEEKAIQAIREDSNLKDFIIKVDLRKYCIASKEDLALQQSRIFSLRGHYLVGKTFYNSRTPETATYLIVENPVVVNTLELCSDKRLMELMRKNFINPNVSRDSSDSLAMVYPQVQGSHLISFLGFSPTLSIPFLNKKYILVDKECIKEDAGSARLINPRKFIANMYEANFFLEFSDRS